MDDNLTRFLKSFCITFMIGIVCAGIYFVMNHKSTPEEPEAKIETEQSKNFAEKVKEKEETKPKIEIKEVKEEENKEEKETEKEEQKKDEKPDLKPELETAKRLNDVIIQVYQGKIEDPNIKYPKVTSKMQNYVKKNLVVDNELTITETPDNIDNYEQFIKENTNPEEGLTLDSEEKIKEFEELKKKISNNYNKNLITNVKIPDEYKDETTVTTISKDGKLYLTDSDYEKVKKDGWFVYKGIIYTINKNYKPQETYSDRLNNSDYQTIKQTDYKIDNDNQTIIFTNKNKKGKNLEVTVEFDENQKIDDITVNDSI